MFARPFFAICLTALAAANAQEDASLSPALAPAFANPTSWVPVHSQAGNEGAALQAVRTYYKATCDVSGMELTPFRGAEAPRSWPFAWRRTSAQRGVLAAHASADGVLDHGGDLAACMHTDWMERWELRAEGVEQSWIFDRLPAGDGDLIISGAIETELVAAKRDFAVAPITFADLDGNAVLVYGTALAIDARGQRMAVPTAWDGRRIQLRIDRTWLDEAELPLLVDPLVSPVQVPAAMSGAPLRSTCIALDNEAANARWLVGVVRSFSASDADLAAYLCDDNYTNPRLIYLDTATATSDHSMTAAYVPGANRWVIAHQRDFSTANGTFSGVQVYFHDSGNTTSGSGQALSLRADPTHSYSAPDLGDGTDNAQEALAMLSFQVDATTSRQNTNASGVRCVVINAAAKTLSTPADLAVALPSSGFDRERPTLVPKRIFSGSPWIAVWTERATQGGTQKARLMASFINPTGLPAATTELYAFSTARHVTRPQVAGMLGDYYVVFGGTVNLQATEANEIFAATFDWNTSASTPVLSHAPRLVASTSGSGRTLVPIELQLDANTFSHAAIAYLEHPAASTTQKIKAHIARLGGTGGVTETATLFASATEDAAMPSVLYAAVGQSIYVASGSMTNASQVTLRRFQYSNAASVQDAGSGCGSTSMSFSSAYAGNRYFGISMNNAPANAPAVMFLSLAGAAIPLQGLGMPGCTLRVDPGVALVASVPIVLDGNGSFRMTIPLPDAPLFLGDAYVQVVYVQSGANALNLQLSRGALIQVR